MLQRAQDGRAISENGKDVRLNRQRPLPRLGLRGSKCAVGVVNDPHSSGGFEAFDDDVL